MLDLKILFQNQALLGTKTLSLNFTKSNGALQPGLLALAYGIGRHLKNLEKLKVCFIIHFYHSHQELSQLVKQIGLHCNRLKELSFDFGSIRNVRLKPPKTFALFRSRIARYFSRVEKLSIDSKDAEYGSPDNVVDFLVLERIGKGRMVNLKKLSLNFADNTFLRYQTFEKAFSYLCESPENLQDLALNFSSCCISARNIKDSILGIGNRETGSINRKQKSKIKSLTLLLNFNTHFGDQGIKDLVSDFAQTNLNESLEDLKLGFAHCPEITIDGLEILGLYISENFTSLKSLDLNLHGCRISNAGLKAGVEALKKCLKRIEKLTLKFFGCKKISDEGLQGFTEVLIENGQNLKEISLTFDFEFLADKVVLESFGWKIGKELENLEYLWLRLLNCNQEVVGDEEKEMFCRNFAELQKFTIKWE